MSGHFSAERSRYFTHNSKNFMFLNNSSVLEGHFLTSLFLDGMINYGMNIGLMFSIIVSSVVFEGRMCFLPFSYHGIILFCSSYKAINQRYGLSCSVRIYRYMSRSLLTFCLLLSYESQINYGISNVVSKSD